MEVVRYAANDAGCSISGIKHLASSILHSNGVQNVG
jgi:hypothetical protein